MCIRVTAVHFAVHMSPLAYSSSDIPYGSVQKPDNSFLPVQEHVNLSSLVAS